MQMHLTTPPAQSVRGGGAKQHLCKVLAHIYLPTWGTVFCCVQCMQITALCPSAEPAQPHGGAAADGEAEQHQPPQHAGPGQPAAVDCRPAFPHLAVLDLRHCAGLLGRPAKLQLDDMQAALPSLRVLKLTGLGGLYGERLLWLLLLQGHRV